MLYRYEPAHLTAQSVLDMLGLTNTVDSTQVRVAVAMSGEVTVDFGAYTLTETDERKLTKFLARKGLELAAKE